MSTLQWEPTLAEVFTQTHAVERTNEESNTSYTWTDPKSCETMISICNNLYFTLLFRNCIFNAFHH